MIEIQNLKLDLVNRQYSITNMLCLLNPFGVCQQSYFVSGHGPRVQGLTFNLNVESIVLVIEDWYGRKKAQKTQKQNLRVCNLNGLHWMKIEILTFYESIKIVIWDLFVFWSL